MAQERELVDAQARGLDGGALDRAFGGRPVGGLRCSRECQGLVRAVIEEWTTEVLRVRRRPHGYAVDYDYKRAGASRTPAPLLLLDPPPVELLYRCPGPGRDR